MDAPHTTGETPEARQARLTSLLRKYEREREHWRGSFAPHMADTFDALIAEVQAELG